ncbi:putative late blight resistance protein homolog R1A-10 [Andrographis paniculata]|uniref:putative late blight resistance protein homolog R1A-10 n=1 Tax=Andrographis paniculata TaxID=175694 RepID=UPI0021E7D426|nr:putative late blight resistance protein homolog R1A-10 [Andrographis paniculata]
MAYYAALASLVHLLEDIVLRDRYPNFLLAKHPILKSLLDKFSFLEESLQDYSSKGDEAGDCVEARIRDAAYRAQDIIELKITDHMDSISSADVNIFSHQISGCQNVLESPREEECEEELYQMEQEADSIVEELKKFAIGESHKTSEDLQLSQYSTTARVSRNDVMVGFEEYLIKIKDRLCGHSSQLQVIPIVGMGGIGKTTLARAAFDDPLSVYHFDRRAWVVVSQDYHEKVLLLSILKSMDVRTDESCEEEEGLLKQHIYQHLIGRRYLIVLDDVWSTKVWDNIKHAFPNVSDGSRILLTTRLSDVAHYVNNSGFLHEMQFLDVNAGWNLLREKVFGRRNCPQELEDIGKFIASKCRGLPLAIVVIAGILSDVQTQQHWKNISRNVGSLLSKSGDEHLSNILSLSYNHLPHLLKACFLYIGSFPEDYEIDVGRLTRLWVAEGFLKSVEMFKTLEEVAEECLQDLVKRNLVLIVKKRANGQFKKCMMHDVLRDFCGQRAVHEGFFHGLDWERCLRNNTDKSVTSSAESLYDYSEPWVEYGARKHVRTILWFKRSTINNASFFKYLGLRLLKILDAADVKLWPVLPELFRMFHVKYISPPLGWSEVDLLSENIFKLENLQTLNVYLSQQWYNFKFPSEFWKMARLRHLIVHRAVKLPRLPIIRGLPLEDLQTLGTVRNFKFSKTAVEMIPNLRKLKILFDQYPKTTSSIWEEYGLSSLLHLRRLEELRINFNRLFHFGTSLGSSFAFPQNLTKLSLSGCRLPWNKMTLVGSLPSLQVLRLKEDSFEGEEWEAIEGEFQQLKFLQMKDLNLKHWRADDMHFPRLQCLKIEWCRILREIPMEIGEISALESITVYYCSGVVEESARLILEEQRSLGNDALRVIVRGYW